MADRDKFAGDMSRNEVEIDLSKFMEMIKRTLGRNISFLQKQ